MLQQMRAHPVLSAGVLPSLLAPLLTLLSLQLLPGRPALTDPIAIPFFVGSLARPSTFSDVRPGLLHFAYLLVLSGLAATLLLRWTEATATGRHAFQTGFIAGTISALFSLPGAFWGITGVFFWIAGAIVNPVIVGISTWLIFMFGKKAIIRRR